MADLGSAIRAAIRQLEGSGEAGTLADEATIELDCLLTLLTTAETERSEAVDRIQQVAWIADDYKSSARAAEARVEAAEGVIAAATTLCASLDRVSEERYERGQSRKEVEWAIGATLELRSALARAALACPPPEEEK